MFRPHHHTPIHLSYSEGAPQKTGHVPIRDHHGSLPTFHTSNATKPDLPKLFTPLPLPGDCNVKQFILDNVTPYHGDASFLQKPTERTLKSWAKCQELMDLELQRGILDVDVTTASTITSHPPGYVLSKDEDVIVGLQTDQPLKRACKPRGGFSVVRSALESYGYTPDPQMEKMYREVCAFLIYVNAHVVALASRGGY